MEAMRGYRTFIVAGLTLLAGMVARYGFKFDPAALTDVVIVVIPAIMAGMRLITRGPVGEKIV